MKPANPVLAASGTTIFEAMSALARAHQAVNLGQGFPVDRGPLALREAAASYVVDGHNQYPPMMGLPVLVRYSACLMAPTRSSSAAASMKSTTGLKLS